MCYFKWQKSAKHRAHCIFLVYWTIMSVPIKSDFVPISKTQQNLRQLLKDSPFTFNDHDRKLELFQLTSFCLYNKYLPNIPTVSVTYNVSPTTITYLQVQDILSLTKISTHNLLVSLWGALFPLLDHLEHRIRLTFPLKNAVKFYYR